MSGGMWNECKWLPSFRQSINRTGLKNSEFVNIARLPTGQIILNFLLENILSTILMFLNRSDSYYEYTMCCGHAVSKETRIHHILLFPWQRHTCTHMDIQGCLSKFPLNLQRSKSCFLSSKCDFQNQLCFRFKTKIIDKKLLKATEKMNRIKNEYVVNQRQRIFSVDSWAHFYHLFFSRTYLFPQQDFSLAWSYF